MTIDHSKLTLYFHLINHYKKLKNVKAKVDCSCPKGYPRICQCKPVKLTSGTPHLHSLLTTPRDYNRTTSTTPIYIQKQCTLKHRERSCSCPPRKRTFQERKDYGSTRITSFMNSEICRTFPPDRKAKYVEKDRNGKNFKKNTLEVNKNLSIEFSKKQLNLKQGAELGKTLLRTSSLTRANECIKVPESIKNDTQTAAFDCKEVTNLSNDLKLSPQGTNEEIREPAPVASKHSETAEKAEKKTQFQNESTEEIQLQSSRFDDVDYTDDSDNKNNKLSAVSINSEGKNNIPKALQCDEDEMSEKYTANITDFCSCPDDNAFLDYEYTTFLLRITEDILRNNIYGSNSDIENLFESHIEANKNHLNEQKMKDKIEQLKTDLNYPFKFAPSPSSKGKLGDNVVSASSCSCIDDIHHLKNNCDSSEVQEDYKNLKCIDIEEAGLAVDDGQYSKAESKSSELIIIDQNMAKQENVKEIISNKINLFSDFIDPQTCSFSFEETKAEISDILKQKEPLKKKDNNRVKIYNESLGGTEISEIISYNNCRYTCHCSRGFQKTALKINPLTTIQNDEYILIDGPVCLPKTMLKEQTISVLIQNLPSNELSSNTSLNKSQSEESKRNLLKTEDPPSVDKNVKMLSISSVLEKEMLSCSDYDLTPEKETFPEKEEIQRLETHMEERLETSSKSFDVSQRAVNVSKQCSLLEGSTQSTEEIWRLQKEVELDKQNLNENSKLSESKACSVTKLDIQNSLKNCNLESCPAKNSSKSMLKKVFTDKEVPEPPQPVKTCDLTKNTVQNYDNFQIPGDTKMLDISDYRKLFSSDEILNPQSNSSQALTFFDNSPSALKNSDIASKYHYLLQDAATSISSSDFLTNYESRMTKVPIGMQTKELSFNDAINPVDKDDTLLIDDYYTVKTFQPNTEPKGFEKVLKKQVSTFQAETPRQITDTSKNVLHESEISTSPKKNSAELVLSAQYLQTSFERQALLSSTSSESSQYLEDKPVPISPSVSEPRSRPDSISSTRGNLKFKYSNNSIRQIDNTNKSVQDDMSTASMVTDRLKQFKNVDFGDNSNRRFQISNPEQFEIRIMDKKKNERYEEDDEEEEEEHKKPRRIKPVCCGIVQSSKNKKK